MRFPSPGRRALVIAVLSGVALLATSVLPAIAAGKDTTPPEPFGLGLPEDGAGVGPRPMLTWDATSDTESGLQYYTPKVDGVLLEVELSPAAESYRPNPEGALGSGTHTWSVVAFDFEGNSRETETREFTVESLPPDSTPPGPFDLIAPKGGVDTNQRPTLTWEAAPDTGGSGLERYELTIFSEAPLYKFSAHLPAGTESFTPAEDLPIGSLKWRVVAADKAGNSAGPSSEHGSFTVNPDPPGPFDLIAPTNGGTYGSRPLFTWEAPEGGSQPDHYMVKLDGGTLGEVSNGALAFAPESDLAATSHTWSVVAVDEYGQETESSQSHTFTVAPQGDATPPEPFALQAPADNGYTWTNPEFSWEPAVDTGLERYELHIDGSKFVDVPAGVESFKVKKGSLAVEPHTWWVIALDKAGNDRKSETRTFDIDTVQPSTFSQLAPDDGAEVALEPTFSWQPATDAGSGLDHYELVVTEESTGVKLADIPAGTETFTAPPSLEGEFEWSVMAVDKVGNGTIATGGPRTLTINPALTPPKPFDLIAPALDAWVGPLPAFSWEATTDPSNDFDHYEVFVDDKNVAEVPAGTETFTPGADLAAGPHSWRVTAVDEAGNETGTSARSFIVISPPGAAIAAMLTPVLTGQSVVFNASGSTAPPGGSITSYEWDLDGNGSFELNTGTAASASHAYSAVADIVVGLRVNSNFGTSSTASTVLLVRKAPPAGPLGVSINGGDQFTNTTQVTISTVWPQFALTTLVSNDGGFKKAGTFAVVDEIPWTLDSSGPERLPKTIYVRFQGGQAGAETYQDDIILDETDPEVVSATVGGGAGASGVMTGAASASTAGVSAVSGRRYNGKLTLQIRARDNVSGVRLMQVRVDRRSGKWRPFKSRVTVKTQSSRIFIRVQDRAGNLSKWRKADTKGKGKEKHKRKAGRHSPR